MKKVNVKYESHIFQNGHIDKIVENSNGNLIINENEINLSFFITQENSKELVTFIFKEDKVFIKRDSYTLEFDKNNMIECDHNTEYGVIKIKTKIKKYFQLANHFVINYELFIGEDSIGKYIIKLSYEEVKEND